MVSVIGSLECTWYTIDLTLHLVALAPQKMKDHISSDPVKGKMEAIKRKVGIVPV
jgi:hypothetical protein